MLKFAKNDHSKVEFKNMENYENQKGSLKYEMKKPILLRIGSPSVDFKSGCAVIDISFPDMNSVEVGSFSLLNKYTASISLKFKTSDDIWKIGLRNFELMPNVHCEEGSQSKFTVYSHQMIHPIKDATLLRFILRQPSPHWLNFSIEHLTFYPPTQISSHLSNILLSNVEHGDELSESNDQVVDVAKKLQNMWALTASVAAEDEIEEPPHFDAVTAPDIKRLPAKSFVAKVPDSPISSTKD